MCNSGCSVIKQSATVIKDRNEGAVLSELSENIQSFNITNNDFYIQKAEIEIYNDNKKQKLLGSVKYKMTGEYLLSIRSKTGIEAARFYLSNDTILINDRINRTIYYGSTDYLEKKYGISISFLPLLFGDYKKEDNIEEESNLCVKGQVEIERNIRGSKVDVMIDCNQEKISKVKVGNQENKTGISLEFGNYYSKERIRFPESIKIEDFMSESVIKIRIEKIEIPWEGVINFIAGKNYKTVRLQ